MLLPNYYDLTQTEVYVYGFKKQIGIFQTITFILLVKLELFTSYKYPKKQDNQNQIFKILNNIWDQSFQNCIALPFT